MIEYLLPGGVMFTDTDNNGGDVIEKKKMKGEAAKCDALIALYAESPHAHKAPKVVLYTMCIAKGSAKFIDHIIEKHGEHGAFTTKMK
jgi:hypothetical protein